MKKTGKRLWAVVLLGVMCMALSGCLPDMEEEEGTPLEFTVVDTDDVPAELMEQIEENKAVGFKLTYTTKEALYLARGYGEQKTGGYSISVQELVLSENRIGFTTSLNGPEDPQSASDEPSYPYIVVKTEYREQNVVFN
jgi:hypothetical protein